MSLPESINTHSALCEEIYDLMIEENRHLRSSGQPPADALLSRKSALLGTLSFSLERLRAGLAEAAPTSSEIRKSVQHAQKTIMKALLLDRENEQLLLKCTMQRRPVPPNFRPAAAQLQRAYGHATAR
jgi:hypothetical protein